MATLRKIGYYEPNISVSSNQKSETEEPDGDVVHGKYKQPLSYSEEIIVDPENEASNYSNLNSLVPTFLEALASLDEISSRKIVESLMKEGGAKKIVEAICKKDPQDLEKLRF
jgi:hypothetical protein